MDLRNNQILVGELLDDPAAHAVFQKRFGKFMHHPMVPAARRSKGGRRGIYNLPFA